MHPDCTSVEVWRAVHRTIRKQLHYGAGIHVKQLAEFANLYTPDYVRQVEMQCDDFSCACKRPRSTHLDATSNHTHTQVSSPPDESGIFRGEPAEGSARLLVESDGEGQAVVVHLDGGHRKLDLDRAFSRLKNTAIAGLHTRWCGGR